MRKIIILITALISITSCENAMKKLNHLKNGKKVQLLYLDSIESKDEIAGEQYVNKRKVLKEFELSEEEKNNLIKTIIKKDNYEPLTRKCKFEPVYAIKVDNEIVAIFDVEFCPALEYFEQNGSSQILQLKTNSTLNTELKKLIK